MLIKTFLVVGLLGLLGAGACFATGYSSYVAGYAFDYEGLSAQRSAAGTIEAGVTEIDIDYRFGAIDLVGAAPGEPTAWSWEVEAWADTSEDAELWADQVKLVVDVSADAMRWTLQMPEAPAKGLNGVRSRLELRVDPAARVQLEQHFGELRIAGIEGGVRAEVQHGDTQLEDLAGKYEGEHRHGDVEGHGLVATHLDCAHGDQRLDQVVGAVVLDASHGKAWLEDIEGALEIRYAHGDVWVTDAGATRIRGSHTDYELDGVGDLDLDCSHADFVVALRGEQLVCDLQHGELRVRRPDEGSHLEHARIETSHADVELELALDSSAEIAATHGDVDVFYPVGYRGVLNGDAAHGDVRSDLPQLSEPAGDAPVLTIETRHGDIRVREQH